MSGPRALNSTPPSSAGFFRFDARDRVLAGLRAGSLAAALAFVAFAHVDAAARAETLLLLGIFAAYGVMLYGLLWRPMAGAQKELFYGIATAVDFVFVLALMFATGGAQSPFYRALYLWTSVVAFNAGLRGGAIGSGLSVLAVLAIHGAHGFAGDTWLVGVQVLGLLLHGPLIGVLVDREREHTRALARAHASLAEAHHRLRDEQERTLQAEKLATAGVLAAGVAHEINNPLAGIMSCLAALRGDRVEPERRALYFETAQEGLTRIQAAVQSLLDYARERPNARARIDLREVVREVEPLVVPQLERKNLSLEVALPSQAVWLAGDPHRLRQAVLNVALNAIYASPPNGRLCIELLRAGHEAGIAVADEGPGIAPDILPRVCDPFFTTKPQGEGTGLGLSVTLGIAQSHGGRLSFENDRGARVTIWLPLASDADARAA